MNLAKHLLKSIAFILCGFIADGAVAQVSKSDSLSNIVRNGTAEEQLSALSLLVNENLYSNQPKAQEFASQQLAIARKQGKPYWEADALSNIGTLCYTQGAIDSAEIFYSQALTLLSDIGDSSKMAVMRVNLSSAQRLLCKFDKAIENLQASLEYFKRQKDDSRVSQVLSNIGAAYNEMGYIEKHDEYALQALAIQERIGSKKPMGITLINLCLSMSAQQKFDEAVAYGERAIRIFRELNEPFFIGSALVRTAGAMLFSGDDKRVIPYLEEAMLIAKATGNDHLQEEVFRLQSNYFLKVKRYSDAQKAALEALALTDTSNKPNLQFLYDLLVTTSIYTNDTERALEYYGKYIDVYGESVSQEWIDKVSEMEVKYETQKKEMRIAALEKERRLVFWLGFASLSILLLLSLLLFVMFRLARQKRILAEQQIKQLEQEKQLVATQAILEGEATERKRLARDLHDGLGGMLSVVKLGLHDVKSGVALDSDDVLRFNKVLEMLDSSIRELRRVAHNMMPESLMRYGLKASLTDFCGNIPNVQFHYFGNEQRLDSKLEMMIYRTAHELVNNALKHAQAQHINIQIVQETDRVSLTVQDDGVGFDPKVKSEGTGLDNIRSRAQSYNGTMDIFSEAGNGTEVNVEFKL